MESIEKKPKKLFLICKLLHDANSPSKDRGRSKTMVALKAEGKTLIYSNDHSKINKYSYSLYLDSTALTKYLIKSLRFKNFS